MTYTTHTPIRGTARANAETALAWAASRGATRLAFLRSYLEEMVRLCALTGYNSDILLCQASHETDSFRSPIWQSRGNPAGMGVTDGPDHGYGFETGADAARAQLVHMSGYVDGEKLPAALANYQHLNPRWQALRQSGWMGTVTVIADLTGKWATHDVYAEGIVRHLHALMTTVTADDDPATLEDELNGPPDTGNPEKEDTDMSMRAHQWPGARRSVYLPTWMPTPQVRIVDHRNVRSYQKFRDQTRVTRHDTGNPRTNANGEYSWLAQGRPGGGAGGYNAIFDDKTLLITVPFDEICWHAGSPQGNRSWGSELAFGGNANWNQAFENGAALDGGLIEMQELNPDNAIVLHQAWTQKYCSAQILNRNLWPTYRRKVAAYARAAATARRGGQTSVPSPSRPGDVPSAAYAAPSLPTVDGKPWDGSKAFDSESGVRFVAQKGTVKTTVNLNRRQWASAESQQTGPMISEGTDVNVLGWVKGELVDGIAEWWIGDSGSRLWAGGIDATPSDEPEWETLQAEKDYGMEVINGRAYMPLLDDEGNLGREIEVFRDGKLYRWAEVSSGIVGSVKAGDTVTMKYWTRGEEHPFVTWDGQETTESVWFSAELHAGDRMWSGLSSRPH